MAREVVFAGDQMGKQTFALYDKYVRDLAEKYDIDIVFSVCHGKQEAVPVEMSFDKVYIFSQLLPKEFEGVRKSHIKGFVMNGKEVLFSVKEDKDNPSNQGPCPQGDYMTFERAPERAIIIRDDNETPMAVILDGNLYVMNDFNHSRSKIDFEVGTEEFEYIWDKAMRAGIVSMVKDGLEEKCKRSLAQALKTQYTQRLEKELVQRKAAADTISAYEKNIMDGTRKLITTDRIIDAIRANIADTEKALNKTWKSLDKMKGSATWSTISFTKTGIKAVSTPITCKVASNIYDFGRFEASLNYDGTCKITCLDRKIDGKYDHPHILDGQVCWGNFVGHIPKLIGQSEFDVALDLIYTFLGNYDDAGAYRKIDYWPKVAAKPKAPEQQAPQEMEARF